MMAIVERTYVRVGGKETAGIKRISRNSRACRRGLFNLLLSESNYDRGTSSEGNVQPIDHTLTKDQCHSSRLLSGRLFWRQHLDMELSIQQESAISGVPQHHCLPVE
jgi:hypothetical protein